MPPAVARIAAVAFGALAFALRLMVTFWIEPLTWRADSVLLGLVFFLASGILPALAVFGGYWLVTRRLSCRPALLALDARRRRLVAPASSVRAGWTAILCMWFAAGGVMTERVPGGDRMRVARFAGAVPVSVAVVTSFLALAALFLVVRRPWVALDPAGLTVQRLRRRAMIAWDDLAPGGPPPPAERRPGWVRVYRNTPAGAPFVAEDLPVGRLHVDAAFLAGAVRHYVAHPERRRAIGTEAELSRLRSAVPERSQVVSMITSGSA